MAFTYLLEGVFSGAVRLPLPGSTLGEKSIALRPPAPHRPRFPFLVLQICYQELPGIGVDRWVVGDPVLLSHPQ